MQILKKRYGFATNSSSTHSIIWLPGHDLTDAGVDAEYFGWDEWLAASDEAKRLWWAAQLGQNISIICGEACPDEYVDRIVASIAGATATGQDIGIDHQSVITLPRRHGSEVIDEAFYRNLVDITLGKDTVIVGGNDNDTRQHPARLGTELDLRLPLDSAWNQKPKKRPDYGTLLGPLVSRYDEEFDQWVVFDQETGTKTRFSFTALKNATGTNRKYLYPLHHYTAPAGFPELVDLKITNYCARGCPWCYQGSTTKGKPARLDVLVKLIDALKTVGTLEVAIGGGEPTSHPQFAHILAEFRRADIVPNFSTGTLDWFDDEDIMSAVQTNCGSFAFTVRSEDDVDEFMDKVKQYNDAGLGWVRMRSEDYGAASDVVNVPQAAVHLVMGTVDRLEFRRILEKCAAYALPVVLLAYKPLGRGKNKAMVAYDWWIAEIESMRNRGIEGTISVDTPLAVESQVQLREIGISGKYFDTVEATRSMYIDAVDMKIAAYSYMPKASMDKLLYCEDINTDSVKIKGKTLAQVASKNRQRRLEIDRIIGAKDECDDEWEDLDEEYAKLYHELLQLGKPFSLVAMNRERAQDRNLSKFILRQFRKYRDSAMKAKSNESEF